MTTATFLQVGFDIAVLGAIFYCLLRRKSEPAAEKISSPPEIEKLQVKLHALEQTWTEWHRDSDAQREQRNAQLVTLKTICDEAAKLLSRKNLDALSAGTNDDEWKLETKEGKELRAATFEEKEIPSLRQLEKTKLRIQNDLQTNLRNLLSDQLA